MSEPIRVEVTKKTETPRTFRKDVMIEQLEKTLKKIPKRGLNNMSRKWNGIHWLEDYYFKSSYSSNLSKFIVEHVIKNPSTQERWGEKMIGYFLPTLPNRLNKLFSPFNLPYLPPQYIALIEEDQRPRARELFSEIISKLDDLYFEIDGVTVMDDILKDSYKQSIHKFKLWMMKRAYLIGWDDLIETELG